MRLLDRVLNIVTVAVVVVFLALTARRYFGPAVLGTVEIMRTGSKVRLAGVDWSANKRTLLFILQPGCSFCKASAGFYRDLLRSNREDAFHPLAIVPAALNEGAEFLSAYGIAIPDVRPADFGTLNVSGTPTLMLVGSDGRLQDSWTGKLTTEREEEVFRALGLHRPQGDSPAAAPTSPAPIEISPAELVRVFTTAPVIDIRDRSEYDERHIAGSVNIPLDELDSRAAHELPTDTDIVVYCRVRSCVVTGPSAPGVLSFCEAGLKHLEQAGFKQVRYVQADLGALDAAGVRLARRQDAGRRMPR